MKPSPNLSPNKGPNRPYLIAQTPNSGTLKHRFLLPAAGGPDDSFASEVCARYVQQATGEGADASGRVTRVGPDFVAVSDPTRQRATGRAGRNTLVLVGAGVGGLSAARRQELAEFLAGLLEPLDRLVNGDIDWDAAGESLVVRRPELDLWLNARYPAGLPSGPADRGTDKPRAATKTLMPRKRSRSGLVLFLLALAVLAAGGLALWMSDGGGAGGGGSGGGDRDGAPAQADRRHRGEEQPAARAGSGNPVKSYANLLLKAANRVGAGPDELKGQLYFYVNLDPHDGGTAAAPASAPATTSTGPSEGASADPPASAPAAAGTKAPWPADAKLFATQRVKDFLDPFAGDDKAINFFALKPTSPGESEKHALDDLRQLWKSAGGMADVPREREKDQADKARGIRRQLASLGKALLAYRRAAPSEQVEVPATDFPYLRLAKSVTTRDEDSEYAALEKSPPPADPTSPFFDGSDLLTLNALSAFGSACEALEAATKNRQEGPRPGEDPPGDPDAPLYWLKVVASRHAALTVGLSDEVTQLKEKFRKAGKLNKEKEFQLFQLSDEFKKLMDDVAQNALLRPPPAARARN